MRRDALRSRGRPAAAACLSPSPWVLQVLPWPSRIKRNRRGAASSGVQLCRPGVDGCWEGNALAAPGAVRVNCAAHGSAENKSFQISGASNLSEIKEEAGRKLLPRRPALSCSLASGVLGGERGIPLLLSWPVPGNQPPFFLFHTGKASGFPLQTSRRLSCLQSGRLSAGRMIKYHCGLKKKKNQALAIITPLV